MIVSKCGAMCKKYGLEESEEVKVVEQLVCSALSLIDFGGISDKEKVIELIVTCREQMGLRQTVLAVSSSD